MSVTGTAQLKARLKAIRLAFKPIGKEWADEAARLAKPRVPVETGKLQGSIRRTHATQRKATVGARYTAYFIDAGARYPKVARRGSKAKGTAARTIFQRSGYRMQPRPFRVWAAREALRRKPMAQAIIREWNAAA